MRPLFFIGIIERSIMNEAENMCKGSDRLVTGKAEYVRCPDCGHPNVSTRIAYEVDGNEIRRINKHSE